MNLAIQLLGLANYNFVFAIKSIKAAIECMVYVIEFGPTAINAACIVIQTMLIVIKDAWLEFKTIGAAIQT